MQVTPIKSRLGNQNTGKELNRIKISNILEIIIYLLGCQQDEIPRIHILEL